MYLGVPISGRRPQASDYQFVEHRIRDHLHGWQASGLSLMGRVTLIRSVLSSLPMHILANSIVLISYLRRIERHFWDSLWASMQDDHSIHLLSWETVCLLIYEGNLGIQSLIMRREALLARHVARFFLDHDSL